MQQANIQLHIGGKPITESTPIQTVNWAVCHVTSHRLVQQPQKLNGVLNKELPKFQKINNISNVLPNRIKQLHYPDIPVSQLEAAEVNRPSSKFITRPTENIKNMDRKATKKHKGSRTQPYGGPNTRQEHPNQADLKGGRRFHRLSSPERQLPRPRRRVPPIVEPSRQQSASQPTKVCGKQLTLPFAVHESRAPVPCDPCIRQRTAPSQVRELTHSVYI